MRITEKLKKDQKGSTFVEAAIVMPLVIMSLISVVMVAVFLAETLFMQVNMHSCIRYRSGMMSETGNSYYSGETFSVTEGRKNLCRTVRSDKRSERRGGFLLPELLDKKLTAEGYVIDEKEIIRITDFFKEEIR